MATASPPSPVPGPPTPRPDASGSDGAGPRRRTTGAGSYVAVGALAIVVLIVAYLVFSGRGGAEYKLLFNNDGQLVLGDQVQVGGVPVGTIKSIELTPKFKARVTISVKSSLTPLHEGTEAQIRSPSLSGVANRYIALSLGPNNRPALANGATLPAKDAHGIVDVDQLFDLFNPETRKALQQVIEGSAQQFKGASKALSEATPYFSPSISATSHVFEQLVSDQGTFTKFLVQSSKAVTTIADRREQLADLIENADQTFQAIGSKQSDFAAALRELPKTFHAGDRTFSELPSTLGALTKLVNVSKPDTKTLAPFLAELRPLLTKASPVLSSFSKAISRPGANNDLTEATEALPALAKELSTSSPDTVTALNESTPITAFFGPYSPDLEGLFRDFGQASAYYDANGHYVHVNPVFADFSLGAENTLTPVTPEQGLKGLKVDQLRRCPGAAATIVTDGSAPFTDEGKLDCDPTETP